MLKRKPSSCIAGTMESPIDSLLFQRTRGNLRGIAKGARRSRKRFVHTFEPCSVVHLTYRLRKGLVWIESCTLVEPHLSLRADLARWGYAALVSEMVLEMAAEGEPQAELFVLLRATLDHLARCRGRSTWSCCSCFAFFISWVIFHRWKPVRCVAVRSVRPPSGGGKCVRERCFVSIMEWVKEMGFPWIWGL